MRNAHNCYTDDQPHRARHFHRDNYLVTALPANYRRNSLLAFYIGILLCSSLASLAQRPLVPPVAKLKKLSVEELMNIEVTSVSKTPQKLAEVASAIQVITHEDIKRSPTTLLPEILRLASNLQVTRAGSHEYAVTARGFNGFPISNSSLADKLLVTIDGRPVYNALFGGVFWDVQAVLKDNIDRIEVVSGPGGTLWGANAVNGVINVITKSAKETQGFLGSVALGTYLRDGLAVRYGGKIDSSLYFRVHANRFAFNSSRFPNGESANDRFDMTRTGFRLDYSKSNKNSFMVQGDFYWGNEDTGDSTKVDGQDIVARWNHNFSATSHLTAQGYFDRTWRYIGPQNFFDQINTVDLDVQHAFVIGQRHKILWGAGYRTLEDRTNNAVTFSPTRRTLELFSGFVQDQVTLVPKRLELTVGTKLLHNDYTKFEFQPSARLAWTPSEKHTIWTAVSRAVRTPSRFDTDLTGFAGLDKPAFRSENVTAYEVGYRMRPHDNVSFSIAGFYNNYEDLRSLSYFGDPANNVLYFGNDLLAKTWGAELSANYIVNKMWRIRSGLTYLGKDFSSTHLVYPDNEKFEAIDPPLQAMLHSIMDLPKHFEFDFVSRYVARLKGSSVLAIDDIPAYFALDVRLAWAFNRYTFSVNAQNITDKTHAEFGKREIPRSIHGRISVQF